jgi:hypothetical protein
LTVLTDDEEADKRLKAVHDTLGQQEQGKISTGWPTLAGMLGEDGKSAVSRVREWLAGVPVPAVPDPQRVRTLDPYTPFPMEALPAPLQHYVGQCAQALGCDPAYLALPVLAVAASVIGNKRAIRLKRGWEELCIV